MNENARVQLINVLRGAASLAVAVFHFNEPFPALPDLYHRAVKFGWLGVPVFFAVSGFCIAAARTKDDVVPFWGRRLVRIYPAYWASIAVVLAVIALRLATAGVNDIAPLPKTAGAFFYTVAALVFPVSPVPPLNWVYWSLGYELAFYLVMGAMATRTSIRLLIPFSILAFFLPVYPFDQWGLFGLGVAAHAFTQKKYWTSVTLAAICLAQIYLQQHVIEAVVAAATVLLILFPPAVILNRVFSPIAKVGLFSYSLYLIHVPIGCYLATKYIPSMGSRQFWPSILHDAVALSVCLVFAYLFYRGVEKPTHELARRKFLHAFKRTRPEASSAS